MAEVLGYVLGPTDDSSVEAYTTRQPWPLHGLVRVQVEGGWALGQVTSTQADRPELLRPDQPDAILEALGRLGDPKGPVVFKARIRLLEERATPVPVGAMVVAPEWEDVKGHFVPGDPDRAWAIGVIRGTEAVAPYVPDDLKDRAPILEPGRPVTAAPGVPAMIDPDDQHQFPHIGIFGGSGSGKSVALRVLCEQMMLSRHPGVVLDPHQEMEFVRPFPDAGAWGRSYARQHEVATVGKDVAIDWRELSTDMVRRLLASAFGEQEWSPNMDAAVGLLHQRKQSLQTFRDRLQVARSNHMSEEQQAGGALEQLRQQHKDVADMGRQIAPLETLQAIERRLNYLDRLGLFSAGKDAARWALDTIRNRKLAVLRGPGRTLEFVGQYVLQALYRARRAYRDAVEQGIPPAGPAVPPFWVVADEAHQFAPRNPEVRAATRGILTEIAQEGRKYGVYLALATQRPALLSETITAQLSTKLVLRTVRAQDLQAIRSETDLDAEATRRLPYLRSGDGYLSLAAQGRTLPVRIRAPHTTGRSQDSAWKELDQMVQADPLPQHLLAAVTQQGGVKPTGMGGLAQLLSRDLGREVSLDELAAALDELAAAGQLVRRDTPFGPAYELASDPDGGDGSEESSADEVMEEVPF